MQKPLALSVAACLGLAGCQVFQKSEAWKEAASVRPGSAAHDPDPSHAYAAKLHTALADRGIEHKVITYQYRYTTRLREEAVGTRTAVVYRDESTANYPWWLKDDRLNTPFWLPNGNLDKQVSFYIRRKAEVIETAAYPAQASAGKTLAFAKPVPGLRSNRAPIEVARQSPEPAKAPAPVIAVAKPKPAPAKPASAPAKPRFAFLVARKPVTPPAAARKPLAKKEPATLPPRKFAAAPVTKKPALKPTLAEKPPVKVKPRTAVASTAKTRPLPAVTSRNSGTHTVWNPPGVLDANEQSSLTAPRDSHLEQLFKRKHGTEYNRFSPTDRRKMQALQQGLASRE